MPSSTKASRVASLALMVERKSCSTRVPFVRGHCSPSPPVHEAPEMKQFLRKKALQIPADHSAEFVDQQFAST